MNKNDLVPIVGIMVPIISTLAFFAFLSIAFWVGYRKRERDAFYKSETLRRITESSGEGAKAAIELLREDDRLKRIKARESLKIAGLINLGVGISLMIFLGVLVHKHGVYLCGLIPGFVGVAMLVYVFFLAGPLE